MLDKPNLDIKAVIVRENQMSIAATQSMIQLVAFISSEVDKLNPKLLNHFKDKLDDHLFNKFHYIGFEENTIRLDGEEFDLFSNEEALALDVNLDPNELSDVFGLWVMVNQLDCNELNAVDLDVFSAIESYACNLSLVNEESGIDVSHELKLLNGKPEYSVVSESSMISHRTISNIIENFDDKLNAFLLQTNLNSLSYPIDIVPLHTNFCTNTIFDSSRIFINDVDAVERIKYKISRDHCSIGNHLKLTAQLYRECNHLFVENSIPSNQTDLYIRFLAALLDPECPFHALKFGVEDDDSISTILNKLQILKNAFDGTLSDMESLSLKLAKSHFINKSLENHHQEFFDLVDHPLFKGSSSLQYGFKEIIAEVADFRMSLDLSASIDELIATSISHTTSEHPEDIHQPLNTL
ncbi:hypothetical protein HNW13_017710 [Shewanella sp. BF02_Schw]|uniref:hypothetical protein n=1 Tax=Shewanella sp. BF02_Schw TaxID=394908 RepID=UPI00178485EF|nr:hypothetical protein [Shewanella sp. BF02_Schw]MBO1897576.1 hypothetical protein [Shewanella sp. BF02_Schw]